MQTEHRQGKVPKDFFVFWGGTNYGTFTSAKLQLSQCYYPDWSVITLPVCQMFKNVSTYSAGVLFLSVCIINSPEWGFFKLSLNSLALVVHRKVTLLLQHNQKSLNLTNWIQSISGVLTRRYQLVCWRIHARVLAVEFLGFELTFYCFNRNPYRISHHHWAEIRPFIV